MDRHKLVESFNCAIEGIVYVLKTQRNMRIHFAAAAVIIVLGIVLNLSRVDFLFICFAVFLVLFAEMFNTAAELTIDLISDTYHPLARLVKDIGAGAVLIASLNAIIIGYIIFARYLEKPVAVRIGSLRNVPLYVAFLALVTVLVICVIVKILMHKGTPMRGGMPSVHSALAFAAWTMVALITPSSPLVLLLAFFIALLVVQSRIASGVHTFTEALLGALLGIVLTVFLYHLYRLVA